MSASDDHPITRPAALSVRPKFLLICGIGLLALMIPDAIADRYWAQFGVLVLATIALLTAWLLLLADRPIHDRRSISLAIAMIYLTLSLPVFLFELSPMKFLLKHPLLSAYAKPWVHWSYAMILLGVASSFLARGRIRTTLLISSVLLLLLRASMGVWVF